MTDKVKQGKTAKRNGKEFEKILDNYFLYLKKIKVCVIEIFSGWTEHTL